MPVAAIWFTGLPGAGKSTLADALADRLRPSRPVAVLDGDRLRQGLNRDLGFAPADRHENARRIAELARRLAQADVTPIVACIAPYAADRAAARAALRPTRLFEVFLDPPAEVCRARDPRGLYRRAAAGAVAGITGLDAPYERPVHPDLRLDTAELDVRAALERILIRLSG